MSARQRLSPASIVRRFSPSIAMKALRRHMAAAPGSEGPGSEGLDRSAGRAALGRIGNLEVRLASTAAEIRRAQKLRYSVFYGELSATADARARWRSRDSDAFDAICDHLIVLDHSGQRASGSGRPEAKIVGTYRLLRQEMAERRQGFYSAREFHIAPLIASKPETRFLELGRSCVLPAYRDRRTLELLWHGIWAYVLAYDIDVMFGCASLPGIDPDRLALPLSFLHHHASAPPEWRVSARADLRVEMNRIAATEIDPRAAVRELPPLVKGYLRLGGHFGDGAVLDRQFGTTDVCVVLPVASISTRYVAHYGADAGRFAS